eukprot:8821164-Alexandrium_andersonii.AAC.1
MPVIKDSDPDVDKHRRNFQSIIDCHSFGRRGVRPLDVLTAFKKTLPAGSIRLRTCETFIDRARRQGRLPLDAKA